MITIPQQLNKTEFRFCKVKSKNKAPYEMGWQNGKTYEEIKDHDGNYGVIGGFGNLVVLDFDDRSVQNDVLTKLPETFTVKTGGSGLYHLYYFCDDCNSGKIQTKDKSTLVDIQGKGKQVIGPGSIHPKGGVYEIVNNKNIVSINRSKIDDVLAPYNYKELQKTNTNNCKKYDSDIEEIKRKLSMKDLLIDYGVDTSKNPTSCPFHSSKGGKCLSFNEEVFKCFHCDLGGDIFTLIMEYENCDFVSALRIAREKTGIAEPASQIDKKDDLNITQEIDLNTQKIKVVMFRRKIEIYNINDSIITSFPYRELKDTVISKLATCFYDLKQFEKLKDARQWISDKNIFKILKSMKDQLDLMYEIKTKEKKKEVTLKLDNYTQNAELFWDSNPFYYDKARLFWSWNKDKFCWEIVDETDMLNCIDKELQLMGQLVTGIIKNNYLEAFRQVGRKHKPAELGKEWVQFQGTLFNIKNKQTMLATPKYFTTNPIPWQLGIDSNTPTIEKLFKEWVGEKYVQTLYEIISYCCYTDYPIHLIFCLTGVGRNGKSQFQELISRFLGSRNLCSTELDVLLMSRFESAKLYRKLVCEMGETNFGVISKTSLLKKLSGQSLISYEFKRKDSFDDYNYAKIVISSNSLPPSEDTSEGFFRRWLIIDFPNTFPEGKPIINTIPLKEYENLAKKVTEILPTLISSGKFTNQGTIDERRKKYILSSNPLSIFLKELCFDNMNKYAKYAELYYAYCKFLEIKKRRIIGKKEFSRVLALEGFEIRKATREGHTSTYVEGVELKTDWLSLCKDNTSNNPNNQGPTLSLYRELSGPSVISVIPDILTDKGQQKRIKWDDKSTAWQQCKVCGDSPCNEFEGFYYCEKHFDFYEKTTRENI